MYLQKINLKNKYALVTGAGTGLGRACSIALAEAGATIIALSRTSADLGNVESPNDPMKIELMIYNKEHIPEILEFIKNNGFPAKNEEGSQFIHIRVPKPSRMQLEEIGDDINRRTNAASSKLLKSKTNTSLRIRAAMEKEFIDQRIAGLATKKIDSNLERCTKEIRIMGLMTRKKILGSFFKSVERDDPELLKIIAKRVKLETQKIENEQQIRLQKEALGNEDSENQIENEKQLENRIYCLKEILTKQIQHRSQVQMAYQKI